MFLEINLSEPLIICELWGIYSNEYCASIITGFWWQLKTKLFYTRQPDYSSGKSFMSSSFVLFIICYIVINNIMKDTNWKAIWNVVTGGLIAVLFVMFIIYIIQTVLNNYWFFCLKSIGFFNSINVIVIRTSSSSKFIIIATWLH